jgi:hypothetical protein
MTEERANYAATPQPKPMSEEGSTLVLPHVLADLQARADWGLAKYQTYLHTNNGRDALVDLYQELLDAVMYVKQALLERESTTDKLTRLRTLVNAILDNHRNLDAPKGDAVNWANLSTEDVGLVYDWRGELSWTVTVAEASPDATQFQDWLTGKLAEAGYMPVIVKTEW